MSNVAETQLELSRRCRLHVLHKYAERYIETFYRPKNPVQ